jgi:hypothetical protein
LKLLNEKGEFLTVSKAKNPYYCWESFDLLDVDNLGLIIETRPYGYSYRDEATH